MVVILHAKNTRDSMFYGIGDIYGDADLRKAWNAGQYQAVCFLETDDLDHAYMLSQNIEESWLMGDKVNTIFDSEAKERGGARSTSVGDLILDEDDNYWVVAPEGFKNLGTLKHPAEVVQHVTMMGV